MALALGLPLSAVTGAHSWTAPATTGPGLTGGWSPDPDVATSRDWVLVPDAGGFRVLEHDTGAGTAEVPITPGEGAGGEPSVGGGPPAGGGEDVTGLSQIGDILYERRDGAVHAYKMLA